MNAIDPIIRQNRRLAHQQVPNVSCEKKPEPGEKKFVKATLNHV